MGKTECDPCSKCYQQKVCEMKGNPCYATGILYGHGEIPFSPFSCFFFCCKVGVIKAKEAIRRAKQDHSKDQLLPFGSSDKPFISKPLLPSSGRYVVFKAIEPDLKYGDVVVRKDGKNVKLTNIFKYKPPKYS